MIEPADLSFQSQESTEGDVALYELARWRFDQQLSQIDALDRKLATILTLNAALIAVFAAAIALRGTEDSGVVWGLVLAVVAVFLANGICAYLAFRLRRWEVRPDFNTFEDVASTVGITVARIWVAREIWSAYQANEPFVAEKARWLRRATALTMVDLALASLTAIVASWPW